MSHYDYLIIGGGMAADAAVKGIRELDGNGSIAVVGMEPHPPYNRPPLSKKLWQGKPVDTIWRKTAAAGAEVLTGRKIVSLDREKKEVTDDGGAVYGYGKLLLATGATPRRFFPCEEIIYFRTFEDYLKLRQLTEHGNHFAVIGGGFIGSEIAAALRGIGKEVTLIFPEPSICSRIFPAAVSSFLNEYYWNKGVEVLAREMVATVERKGAQIEVTTGNGRTIAADGVIAGLGVSLNTELALQAGCTVAGGVEVNELLQAAPDIFAAGDIVSYHSPDLEKRVRFEHEDNALTMGRHAGRNMAGAGETYAHLPYFYSDMFDIGYEAVGLLDAGMETFIHWQEPFRKGVIYYLEDSKVRGVLLWNVWEQVENARRLIRARDTVRREDLEGRIPL